MSFGDRLDGLLRFFEACAGRFAIMLDGRDLSSFVELGQNFALNRRIGRWRRGQVAALFEAIDEAFASASLTPVASRKCLYCFDLSPLRKQIEQLGEELIVIGH